MPDPIVRSTYYLQGLGAVGAGFACFLIVAAFYHSNYWLVVLNVITFAANIQIIHSNRKLRQQRTHGFSKHAVCSCGACDWGTLTRQYDEVPVCRNCWTTWRGK